MVFNAQRFPFMLVGYNPIQLTNSGIQTTQIQGASNVVVTFANPQYKYPISDVSNPVNSQDNVPALLFFGGSVVWEKDQFGNVIARNKGPRDD